MQRFSDSLQKVYILKLNGETIASSNGSSVLFTMYCLHQWSRNNIISVDACPFDHFATGQTDPIGNPMVSRLISVMKGVLPWLLKNSKYIDVNWLNLVSTEPLRQSMLASMIDTQAEPTKLFETPR